MVYAGVVLGAVFVTGLFWYGFFYRRERELLNRLLDMIGQAERGEIFRKSISEGSDSGLDLRYLSPDPDAGF